MSIIRVAACAIALTTFAGVTRAGDSKPDWRQWRGPNRDGVSPDTGLLKKWPKEGPTLLWQAKGAGQGYGSIVVADGRVYTQGGRGDYEYLIAFDVDSGQEMWARSIGKKYTNREGDGSRGTPTIDKDRIFALGANGDLTSMDAKVGTTSWALNILKEFGAENSRWGISESPLIDDMRLIVQPGGKKACIAAINKFDASVIWRCDYAAEAASYASAILVNVDGVSQVIDFTDSAAVGIKADDGRMLWHDSHASNKVANCTTPIYRDGHVFITSAYDTGAVLLTLTSSGGKTSAKEVYFTREMMNHHGGVVLVGDYLYGFSNSTLVCMEFKTGKVMWKNRSVGKGSIVAADGMLYCLSEKGIMGLVKATPQGYEEASRFSFEVDGPYSWAHPVVTGGRLFIRNGDQVRCYDVKQK